MEAFEYSALQEVMEIVIRHSHLIVREAKLMQGERGQAITRVAGP
jgi:hypothetical protein